MIDLKLLEKRGVSAKAWKAIFTLDANRAPTFDPNGQGKPSPAEPDDKKKKAKKSFVGINDLRNRMRLRIQAGRDWNFKNYQIYKGVDDAFDVPINKAVTPTLLSMLANRTGDEESLKKELSAWGFNLSDVLVETADAKVDGKSVKKVSAPAFFQVYVPLVKAYSTIRQAKIMNDMLNTPFFEYQPAWESATSRLQCDALTSRVEVMSEQFGYYDTIKEAVHQMLHYGRSFQFPVEEWYSEEQEVEKPEDASQEDGKPLMHAPKKEGETGRYYKVVKEGLRYHFPHPTRTFWDQAHAPCTFNTDTGCEFAGYWRVERYRDVLNNEGYFNTDRISIGNYNWYGSNAIFFSTVYPCQMSFPGPCDAGTNDRETKMLDNVYSQDMGDKAVVISHYVEKLIPSDYGLGDYDFPVWCRFVVAGDDTVIYAAPFPYAPTIYYGYDDDQARAQNASLSLEVLPWQDHLSNLLTQYLLAIKQNLANVTFVDSDMVDESDIKGLKNLGEKLFRMRNFIPFSGRLFKMKQAAVPTAFYSHSFPQLDTNGIIQAMKMCLDLLERVLQMSSQELGAAASHEQSKAEVVTISQHTSTRLQYTTTPVNQGRHAMMKQLYYALMAYGDEEFWTEIPMDHAITAEELEKLGFTYDAEKHPHRPTARKMVVRAKKAALLIERFAQLRQGEDRQKNTDIAMALLQSLDRLLKGPMGPAIGAEQGITLVNLAGRLAGWPRDFKLKNMSPTQSPEQQAEQVKEQLSGYITEIENKILGEVKQGLMPMLEHQKALEEAVAKITEIVEVAQAHRPAPAQLGMPVPGQPAANGNGMPASPFRY